MIYLQYTLTSNAHLPSFIQKSPIHTNIIFDWHILTFDSRPLQVENMLWSDPSLPDGVGLQPSTSRGAGNL